MMLCNFESYPYLYTGLRGITLLALFEMYVVLQSLDFS